MLHDFWGYNISINGSHKSYRPLAILTLRWNYALSGGLSPYSMHLVNIILHSVVSVLVLKVVSLMFTATSLQDSRSSFPYPRASLLSGVLFAVHPVHTESVVANVGRADLICALFFFLAMLVYIKLCSRNSKNPLHVYWP
uniref:Transmembrane and TPR repeat-containing protein 4-like n=1 Tax=Saccoglossus kowalevskii TaxID=10224 RepID=A0ABM0MD51_SACKO|nr:PREDICTED: transmembrane and TPR repeat-containing protein 4-like [Saccoglossus kowalevskii]